MIRFREMIHFVNGLVAWGTIGVDDSLVLWISFEPIALDDRTQSFDFHQNSSKLDDIAFSKKMLDFSFPMAIFSNNLPDNVFEGRFVLFGGMLLSSAFYSVLVYMENKMKMFN
jgi:hypothetical protein